MTCCGTLKQEKMQKVEELEKSIKDMDKDSIKDTAKRKNEVKQADAKLQGLEHENTKLQEEIFKHTKNKAARDTEDENARKQVKTEQD